MRKACGGMGDACRGPGVGPWSLILTVGKGALPWRPEAAPQRRGVRAGRRLCGSSRPCQANEQQQQQEVFPWSIRQQQVTIWGPTRAGPHPGPDTAEPRDPEPLADLPEPPSLSREAGRLLHCRAVTLKKKKVTDPKVLQVRCAPRGVLPISEHKDQTLRGVRGSPGAALLPSTHTCPPLPSFILSADTAPRGGTHRTVRSAGLGACSGG